MKTSTRKQLFIDPEVQGAIVARIVVFWLSCILFMVFALTLGQTLADPNQMLYTHFWNVLTHYWPVLGMMLVMFPCVLYDLLKLSNRFVGPIHRLRSQLARLENGEQVGPTQFRTGDFWPDVAAQFNQLVERLAAAEKRVVELEAEAGSEPAESVHVG